MKHQSILVLALLLLVTCAAACSAGRSTNGPPTTARASASLPLAAGEAGSIKRLIREYYSDLAQQRTAAARRLFDPVTRRTGKDVITRDLARARSDARAAHVRTIQLARLTSLGLLPKLMGCAIYASDLQRLKTLTQTRRLAVLAIVTSADGGSRKIYVVSNRDGLFLLP